MANYFDYLINEASTPVTADIAQVAAIKNYRQNVVKVTAHCNAYAGDERHKCKHVFKVRALRKFINDLSKVKSLCKSKTCITNIDKKINTNKKKLLTLQKQLKGYK